MFKRFFLTLTILAVMAMIGFTSFLMVGALDSPSANAREEQAVVPNLGTTNMKNKRNVAILEVHPIGNYAVRLVFDDMHSTGIYSWDYFAELGRNRARKWQDYVDELASKGLSRDPPQRR